MKTLLAKKVAILIETEYIPMEIKCYQDYFSAQGATVDLITNLWGAKERILVADVTEPCVMPECMIVSKDIIDCNVDDYAIILIAANYVACRLREIPPMGNLGKIEELDTPPAVQFIAKAMENKKIVKGALCHALWLLTPMPSLLKDRKVICHTVVLADVHNAGATFVPNESHVVVDNDLVTGRSAADLQHYVETIEHTYLKINS